MKTILVLLALLILSACSTIQNWTEQEKQTAWIVAAVVVGAVIVAEGREGDIVINNQCHVHPSQKPCQN